MSKRLVDTIEESLDFKKPEVELPKWMRKHSKKHVAVNELPKGVRIY